MGKIKKLIKACTFQNFKSVLRYIKNNGIKGLFGTCLNKLRFGKVVLDEYATWMANNEPNPQQLEKQTQYKSCQDLSFTFVCPDSDKIEKDNYDALLASIRAQTYSKYEIEYLKKNNENIKEIVENAKSDYFVFLGKDIELAPFALYEIVKSIEARDSILIYSDNDKFIESTASGDQTSTGRKRMNPHFKPDFGRDTILSTNYIGNMIAVKAEFLKLHDDILEDLNKNIIYELILNISEKTRKIEHIQKILYYELKENMDIDTKDEKAIIKKHLKRCGIEFKSIEDGKYFGQYKINYKIKGNPLISLVVPNKDLISDLDKLMKSVEKSTYENYEVVIVENNSEKEETFKYYEKLKKRNPKVRVVDFKIDYFNYSAIVNFGVEHSKGEYIVLLNNDIEFLTANWMEELLMYTQRPEVGICGTKLLFPDRSIQHAGVTIGTRGLAGHRSREVEEKDYKRDDYINIVQNLSAVTAACFMVRKDLYIDLLGFDEKLAVAFNDVDFCLKVRNAKYLIVYNPFIEAYHYESKSRGQDDSDEKQKRFAKEYEIFVKRWSKVIGKGDPYYNKNYRLDTDIQKINYNKIVL